MAEALKALEQQNACLQRLVVELLQANQELRSHVHRPVHREGSIAFSEFVQTGTTTSDSIFTQKIDTSCR
jgi:hypothetical protein